MTIKEIIAAEKSPWRRGGSVSDMLDRIEAAVVKRITELEEQVESAYKQGYDDGHAKGFTEGYNEKEQELT